MVSVPPVRTSDSPRPSQGMIALTGVLIHTRPTGEGWASIIERGPQETLATSTLPNFSIRLCDVD
jgi:hypothetical protein